MTQRVKVTVLLVSGGIINATGDRRIRSLELSILLPELFIDNIYFTMLETYFYPLT